MRKHFLILMLMALLPLAGWADGGDPISGPTDVVVPGDEAPFKVGNAAVYAIKAISNGELVYNKSNFAQTAWQIKYQTAENGPWLDLTSGYALEYYDSENAATAITTAITDAGDYWLGIKPADGSETCSGTLAADKRFKFTIKQAPLYITIANGEKNYGDETPDWQWEVAEGTQFAPGDNKTNVAINIVATAKEGDNLNWGGTHTYASVTATEANGNYKVTVTNAAELTLKVNKADLVFKIGTEGTDFVKNYYELESSLKFDVTSSNVVITGARNGETITPVYTTSGKISYTYNLANHRDAAANAKTNGELFSTAEGANKDYKISFSGIELNETDAKNYNITYEDRFVHIKQIEINSSDNKFTFTPGSTNFTYTGEKQEPTNHTITYKWGNDNQKITLTKGVDYDFAYKLGNTTDPINASSEPGVDNPTKYAVTIVAATGDNAKKNFTVATAGVAMSTFDFPIYKKQLDILVNPQKKEYIGATAPTFDKKFTITGFVDADKEKTVENLDVEPVPATNNANAVTMNVGKYFQQVKIVTGDNPSQLTWTEGDVAQKQSLTLNYWINKLTSGYFEVTPKAVTVGAKDNKTITYGATLPTAKALSDQSMTGLFDLEGVVEADLTAVKGLLKLGLKTQYNTTGETPVAIDDKEYYTEATTYTGCWVITEDTGNDTNGLLKNYKITKNAKDFIINKAGFTMMAVQDQKEYDGKALTADDFAYVAYSGSTPVELPKGVTVEYEVLDAKTGEYTQTFPSAVGEYTYRVKVKPEYASGNFSGDIANPTATFTITPKTIYIQVQNVSLHEGDDETILNKYAKADYVPVVDTDGNTIDTKPWTIGKDKLVLVYNFTDVVKNDNAIWNSSTKKLMYSSDETKNKPTKAVTVRLATAADFEEGKIFAGKAVNLLQNGNYVIAPETDDENTGVTKGQLFIHQGVFTTFDVAAGDYIEQLETATTAASQSGATGKNVRFKNTQYTLPAGKWSTLVLPFAITPLEFCNMTGISQYAIFNKLTSANASTNVVRFSLEQENLPANTPFLVKAPKDIVLDDVEFTNRFVKYDETPTATVSQAKFIGSYVDVENIEGGANKMWWDKKAGNFVKATDGGVAKAFPNYCFHAYLVLDSSFSADANVRILVEEADGTVTAISNINAEGVAVPAEGWYTINGVKLQGAPTQKGIYINNGKKIVVK